MYFEIERIQRILTELKEHIYTKRKDITEIKIKHCDYGAYEMLNEDCSGWDDYDIEGRWGGKDQHCWFRTRCVLPEEYKGCKVVFEVKTGMEDDWDALNPQFLIYLNGKVVQGLDVNHREIFLTDHASGGEVFELMLYAYSGLKDRKAAFHPSVAVYHDNVQKLYYDIKVPLEVAELLEKEDKRRLDILNYLTEAVNLIDFRKEDSKLFYESVDQSLKLLNKDFYEDYCHEQDITELCVGHTHIDVAWLWTLAQTREKAARSFSTVLNLMKRYPEYIFMSSQPQLYQYVKEDHPAIYAQIKDRVKEGRWEPEGAMWLEADCNLTSGESLVRQIVYGKRFFKQEFGIESKILWLPDVFGYSAALPQILQKSGVQYFMTTKISWNEYNKMPYDTFWWRGIDGSEIFTHFVTTRDYEKNGEIVTWTTYNGDTSPLQVMGCWQRYQHKDMNDEVLNCFGFGDGGGGPTVEMLENVIRLEKGIPGAPQVKMGTALEYFNRLEKKVRNHKRMPRWVGELYLEYHRGTYTSMARNKKANRKAEFLNLDAEMLSALCKMADLDYAYPELDLKTCWEKTLLNQFHDIIPGSSIKPVYEDSKNDYEYINRLGRNIVERAIDTIASKVKLENTSVVVFNQLGFDRNDIIRVNLPEGWRAARVFDQGRELVSQLTEDGELLFYGEHIPSKGYKTFELREEDTQPTYDFEGITTSSHIENKFYDMKLDGMAEFTSIYDKVNRREVLKQGEKGNVLQAFEDKPHNFDAWDINIYYLEKMWTVDEILEVKVLEKGPVRQTLYVKKRFMDSIIEQRIYFYRDIARIDFSNRIDWKEKQILLKAAFPVDVMANKATYEIQYGNVERPTHWNTSWDYARFEVCAHKWADLSEEGYGVSLLNDCKYGHDIKDSVMRLTLIKSAADPNEDADREIHEFSYTLFPHTGDFREGQVIPMAYNINCPLYAVIKEKQEGSLENEMSLIKIDQDNVVIEVIKKAEDSDDLIVRLYECHNKRTNVSCTLSKDIIKVRECDLLENDLDSVSHEKNIFSFCINPYEIKTFKITM